MPFPTLNETTFILFFNINKIHSLKKEKSRVAKEENEKQNNECQKEIRQ